MANTSLVQQLLGSPSNVALTILSLITAYLASIAIYNIYFHPLAKFPGPKFHAASRIPYCFKLMRGTWPYDVLPLHEKYGDFVRIAPDELAISHPDAWKSISGHKTIGGSGEEMSKFAKFYAINPMEPPHIVNASRDEHSRLRRQLANGFSDKSMRDQEPMIGKYIDLLIQRLHENCAKGALDIAGWYNFTTFDVIGDLAFGESFGCLENSQFHPWVKMIFEAARVGTILQSANFFPTIKSALMLMIPKSVKEATQRTRENAHKKLARRIEKGERPDLIEGLLRKKDEWNLSMDQLESNANILVIGGSETTATLLSGATYLLLTNPSALTKLTQEVRQTFKSESEIDIISVGSLKYMLACLDESLRMYPPVPTGLPRVVPKSGAKVVDKWIPGDSVVAVHQWASYRNAKYWKKPFEFHPERFLGDEEFASDKREILQPFSVGPRNCLGRNLAYAEMRLILARVVYNFDMRIDDECKNWMDNQKIFFLWSKPPLKVHLTPVSNT